MCAVVPAEEGPREGAGLWGPGEDGNQDSRGRILSPAFSLPALWSITTSIDAVFSASRIHLLLHHLHGHHLVLPPLSPHWCPCSCLCSSDPVPPLLRMLPGLPPHPEKNPKSLLTGTHRPSMISSLAPSTPPPPANDALATLNSLLLLKHWV